MLRMHPNPYVYKYCVLRLLLLVRTDRLCLNRSPPRKGTNCAFENIHENSVAHHRILDIDVAFIPKTWEPQAVLNRIGHKQKLPFKHLRRMCTPKITERVSSCAYHHCSFLVHMQMDYLIGNECGTVCCR